MHSTDSSQVYRNEQAKPHTCSEPCLLAFLSIDNSSGHSRYTWAYAAPSARPRAERARWVLACNLWLGRMYSTGSNAHDCGRVGSTGRAWICTAGCHPQWSNGALELRRLLLLPAPITRTHDEKHGVCLPEE